jgi:hypothetical protein
MLRSIRKRRWREWKERIECQANSGLSALRWCKDQKVAYNTFLCWRKRLKLKTSYSQTNFTELIDPAPQEIVLEFFGARLLLPKEFDESTLFRFLRILKSC